MPADRRTYAREYARKRRAAALAAQLVAAPDRPAPTRCPKGMGAGRCGGPLETRVGRHGETVVVCPWCERQRRGVCRDCSHPVAGTVGKALRCAVHKAEAQRAQVRASELRHREERRQRAREYYQQDETRRQRRNEYNRAWRKANPDKVKKQKRREALRQRRTHLAYHRRYNAKKARQLRKRQQAMLTYYREHPERPAPRCAGCTRYLQWSPLPGGKAGKPPKWCDDCCPQYQLAARRKRGTSILAGDEPPLRAYLPPLRELEQRVGGLRTCVTPGCDIVVTGRKKKCARCKARDAAHATALLAAHTGQGRRTDLEREAAA